MTVVRLGDGSTAAIDGDLFATNSIEARMEAAVGELNERVARCHEVVPCPRCCMPTGVACVALKAGGFVREPVVETKHPHGERIAAAGIPLR